MILTLILIALFFVFKAFADTLNFHWSTSIFFNIKNANIKSWFDPNSWKFMYKDSDPTKGEKFWGSSRWFAFLTSGWHFFSLFQILSFLLSLTLYNGYIPLSSIIINNVIIAKLVDTFVFYCIGSGVIFELLYGKLLKK